MLNLLQATKHTKPTRTKMEYDARNEVLREREREIRRDLIEVITLKLDEMKTDIMTKITEVVELTVSTKLQKLHEKLEGIQLQTMLDDDTLIINNDDEWKLNLTK